MMHLETVALPVSPASIVVLPAADVCYPRRESPGRNVRRPQHFRVDNISKLGRILPLLADPLGTWVGYVDLGQTWSRCGAMFVLMSS